MGRYSRLGKNTILVFLGNAGSKLIGIIMLPFYTRWLSVEGYGLTDILSVYVTLLVGIVSCKISESLFIFPKGGTNEEKKEYYSTGIAFIIIALMVAGGIFGICQIISNKTGLHNSFFDNIWLVYGMIACTITQEVTQQFTRCLDKMKVYSITGIVVTSFTALFSFIFIPTYGVNGYIMSLNFANLVGATYSSFFSGSYRFLNLKAVSIDKCRTMLKYSIPLIPNSIMWWMVGAINRPIMESSIGLQGVGLFAVANKFPGILTMLFSVFSISWQISILEEYDKDGFSEFYNKIYRFIGAALFVTLGMVTLMSRWLISLFTTPSYYGAWVFVPMLTFGALLSSFSTMGGTVFSAVKESKFYFYSSVWGAIAAVIANVILIPLYGAAGAAISVVISFAAMGISRNYYAWKYVRLYDINKYIYMVLIAIIIAFSPFFVSGNWFYIINIVSIAAIILINLDLRVELNYVLKLIINNNERKK